MNRRISPQEAFERLLTRYNGWTARERFNAGLRNNDVRIWEDGRLLTPTEIQDRGLYVRAEVEPDARWRCTIEESRRVIRVPIVDVDDSDLVQTVRVLLPPSPTYEVDAEGIYGLLPASPRKRGPKSGANLDTILSLEHQRLQRKASTLLNNPDQFVVHMVEHLETEGVRLPKDRKRLHRKIRGLLGGQIKK